LDEFLTPNEYIYIRIKKGMYDPSSLLAYQHLVTQLAPHGYHPCPYTTGLWKHETRQTKFCLCVDDFGVKYYSRVDGDHLLRHHLRLEGAPNFSRRPEFGNSYWVFWSKKPPFSPRVD
jgi:hypothetical protein